MMDLPCIREDLITAASVVPLAGLCELPQIHSALKRPLTLSNQPEIDNHVSQSGSALLKIQPIAEQEGGHIY